MENILKLKADIFDILVVIEEKNVELQELVIKKNNMISELKKILEENK